MWKKVAPSDKGGIANGSSGEGDGEFGILSLQKITGEELFSVWYVEKYVRLAMVGSGRLRGGSPNAL